jgi:hypothetical protein
MTLHQLIRSVWCHISWSGQYDVTSVDQVSMMSHQLIRSVWCHISWSGQYDVTSVDPLLHCDIENVARANIEQLHIYRHSIVQYSFTVHCAIRQYGLTAPLTCLNVQTAEQWHRTAWELQQCYKTGSCLKAACACGQLCKGKVVYVDSCVKEQLCLWTVVLVDSCVKEQLCLWTVVLVDSCVKEQLCLWTVV